MAAELILNPGLYCTGVPCPRCTVVYSLWLTDLCTGPLLGGSVDVVFPSVVLTLYTKLPFIKHC